MNLLEEIAKVKEEVPEMEKSVRVISDKEDRKVVVIPEILFKGKRAVPWDTVKEYLRKYVGNCYKIETTEDMVYIGSDLPDEYTGSRYTYSLKGANAKAKANAAQGIPELLQTATGKYFRENSGDKHLRDAAYGWYRYDAYFALSVCNEKGETERYNMYHASMLIRHAKDGKYYLYDILDIKKETSNPFQSEDLTWKKPIS